jgi:CDP-diacylglycerol--serine O-phosphatidyltransferase
LAPTTGKSINWIAWTISATALAARFTCCQPVHHRRPVRRLLRDHRRGQRFVNASIAVFVAAVMDGLDGRVARLTGTSSEFGVQYDSLADLVSFGIAPALVMYHWSLSWLKFDDPLLGRVGWAVAFLYAACAALRLARFNTRVAVVDKRWFVGLAGPAAAGLMMSFVWAFADGNLGWDGNQLRYVALAVTIIAALLMVSRIRFWSFKGGGARAPAPTACRSWYWPWCQWRSPLRSSTCRACCSRWASCTPCRAR